MDLETLHDAVHLYTLSLQSGSSVDIFFEKDNCFYEALVTDVENRGFNYIYKNRHREGGFVSLKDFLGTWRPPVNQRFLNPETLILMYDSMNSTK